MVQAQAIHDAKEHFGTVLEQQLARVEAMKQEAPWTDYSNLSPIIIGNLGGDGIGPYIAADAQRVLEQLLADEVASGKVQFRTIEGLTIENRAAKLQSIPDDVLEEIRGCHVTMKGPTHTPEQGDGWPNIESANVSMRKHLDLFANVRPVRVPALGIDWTFFRENTEDLYAVGSQGLNVTPDLAVDFRVITSQGSRRIIDAAFAHAQRTGKDHVTIVTKANVVKTTDGKFLDIAREVVGKLPGHLLGGVVHRPDDSCPDKSGSSEGFPSARTPQPLRRHPHRRGCPDSGRRWHCRQRQRGQGVLHV